MNFRSLANFDSFANFYNHILLILSSIIAVAKRLMSAKEAVIIEIRTDMVNISSVIQPVNGIIDLNSFLDMIEDSMQSRGGGRSKLTNITDTTRCRDCRRCCRSLYCFNKRKTLIRSKDFTQCETAFYCEKCNSFKANEHICGEKCKMCGEELDFQCSNHECFIHLLRF